MSEFKTHPVPDEFRRQAHIDAETYERWYQESLENPDQF